jgi:hypothetical protein
MHPNRTLPGRSLFKPVLIPVQAEQHGKHIMRGTKQIWEIWLEGRGHAV